MKGIALPRPGPYCKEDAERLSLAPVSARRFVRPGRPNWPREDHPAGGARSSAG